MDLYLSQLNNQYTVLALSTFVALYAAKSRVTLPQSLRQMFQSDVFRVLFLSLLLIHRFDQVPHVAICVSLVFLLTMHHLNKNEMIENFESLRYRGSLRLNN